jgi:hypothetical protein
MFEQMDRRGLLEDTLILLVGDHGEAFGNRHRGNLIHKNFLYEENLRSFLVLLAPGLVKGLIVSERVATMGDVLPTVLRALGAEPVDIPGQSLWPSDYEPRPVFFHKNTHPELWGLHDGQWKFVAHRSGEKHAELYDLHLDPEEQENRVYLHPERVELYDRLCAKWFAVANRRFVERLRDYEPFASRMLAASELDSKGPKRLIVGTRDTTGRFTPGTPIRGTDFPVAWTLWVPYEESRASRYAWTSPSGDTWSSLFTLDPDWSRTRVNYPGPYPLAEGRWRITPWDRDEALLSAQFEVARSPDASADPVRSDEAGNAALKGESSVRPLVAHAIGGGVSDEGADGQHSIDLLVDELRLRSRGLNHVGLELADGVVPEGRQ